MNMIWQAWKDSTITWSWPWEWKACTALTDQDGNPAGPNPQRWLGFDRDVFRIDGVTQVYVRVLGLEASFVVR